MAINIQVGSGDSSNKNSEEQKEKEVQKGKPENLHKLNIRKSLDGKIIVYSHEDLDIVIDQKNGKILAMATDEKVSDRIYDSQNRLFKFLNKKGIIDPASVKMSNIYGVLEAKILTPENSNINQNDLVLLNIAKWVDLEAPEFTEEQFRKKDRIKDLTDPEDDETTRLGKVPHRKIAGSGGGFPGMQGTGQTPVTG
jgi:cell division protein FtsI/penicillin-binding protein 2